MDVHAASCTLAVISEKGRKLKDFPVETNGQALVEAIRMIPGHKHLVMEEGLQSAWLYETLSPHVDELVVAGITQSRGPKSDKRDAYGLAEKLRVGNLDKVVFKAPRQFARLREFSRTHMTLVTDVVRTQARIKSVYRSRGVLVTGIDVYGPRRREEWLNQLPFSTKIRATRLYDHLDFLLEQKKQAEVDLLREGKNHPIVKILETAPGFGPIRAARLVPIVITPHRFRTKRQFWSYCGLGIVTRSSSDLDQVPDSPDARTLASTQSLLEGHLQRWSFVLLLAIFSGTVLWATRFGKIVGALGDFDWLIRGFSGHRGLLEGPGWNLYSALREMVEAQRLRAGPTNPDQWASADPVAELVKSAFATSGVRAALNAPRADC
jgi:transposase